MKQIHKYGNSWIGNGGQGGGLTVFSAVLILMLMTIVLVYATRVSIFETRISGNEVRQKEAFNVAEAALGQGMMYVLSNANVVVSSRADVFEDGTADSFTKDGWFANGNVRWQACPTTLSTTQLVSHPCGGNLQATEGAFYYDTDGDTSTVETLPINEIDFPTGSTARMSAIMCFVDLANPTGVCVAGPTTSTEEKNTTLVVTLLSYGYSDCTDTTDISTCIGEATVAMPISSYKRLSGAPGVPLVAKATVPLDGTFEVVGNPNGGGVGVPLSIWKDASASLLTSGTWQTCEMEEWYHQSERPDDVACADNNCLCGPGGNDTDYFLSWRGPGGDTHIGIDIVEDPAFPPDLFEFYFGIPRQLYMQIKGAPATQVMSDCTGLGSGSSGLIWIDGPTCSINAGAVIGSHTDPVVLVSAAELTTINGGASIFGILYIFDGDPAGSEADLKVVGGATVYGAVIVDGGINQLNGTFQVVYNEDVLLAAQGIAGLGSTNGGWRDFGLPNIAW